MVAHELLDVPHFFVTLSLCRKTRVTKILAGLATLAHDYQPADWHGGYVELEAKLKRMVDAIAGDSFPS